MPTTVNELIKKFDLPESKVVKWKETISTEKEGIYIVSLSKDPELNSGILEEIPISKNIIDKWIQKVNGFELDKVLTFDKDLIIERLSEFWLPDENIVYIGKAPIRSNGKGIGNRVREFYKTEYGEKRPHAGGHWIKSLSNLNDLYVHYILCDNSGDLEIKLLKQFIDNISDKSKRKLRDKELMLPFANLELKKGQIKKHGLGKMKK
ncbi:MAG: hypothetical protein R2776_06055 [Flavobacteriaceae bacterium]|nr:hypothetical protein [Flavobacteriaceae bacterium]